MSMKVDFTAGRERLTHGVVVVPVAEGAGLSGWLAELNEALAGRLAQAVSTAAFRGRCGQDVEILAPDGNIARLLLVGAGKAAELDVAGGERLGGRIAAALKARKVKEATILATPPADSPLSPAEFAARVASGVALRNYVFDRYKSKKGENGGEADEGCESGNGDADRDAARRIEAVSLVTENAEDAEAAAAAFAPLRTLAESVHFARDLVNEPGNVLTPAEFATRLEALTEVGLEIEVLDRARLEELGFGALLAVARGSANAPRVVVLRWNGGGEAAPLVFVGKGVTFDSGGISIKPSQGMDEMKGDMAGAAAVAGVMRALATQKAAVNAVGVVGLVENMPDGSAQRPGDIVRAFDGQTIAVLNTDAEGRLVLADCLAWAKATLKPALMVDLATLTGAILIALGKEHAGLFANDDELAAALETAGRRTGEKVWRLPLGRAYDKLIDHDLADMKNVGGRNAGSITAAQFLKRFVGDVPWAHLDVAGTAMAAEKSDLNDSWGSGWGVRLLDTFVREREGRETAGGSGGAD